MATILAFTPRKVAGGVFPGPLAKAGDVIIFPGVRYEQGNLVTRREEGRADGGAPAGDDSGAPRH
jgi:hypothetical protein